MSWFGWGSSKKEEEGEAKEIEADGEEDEVIGSVAIQTGNKTRSRL